MENNNEIQSIERLSKGCQLCQQGKWLCIFLTYTCQGNCHFCPAPSKSDTIHSAFGNSKEIILSYLEKNDFKGISYSGGDPLLVFDRLIHWQTFFKQHLPDYYFWVYTNGLTSDKRKFELLAKTGIDEIRFNIAASGYLSEKVWENIKIAREYFPFVAVEIPSIHKDNGLLLQALELMESSRIDYLNLHDYIRVDTDPEFPSENTEQFVLNQTIPIEYSKTSRENTLSILQQEQQFSFRINHCSIEQKELQMTERRKKMAGIFCDPEYDTVSHEGFIINYYKIPSSIPIDEFRKSIRNTCTLKQFDHCRLKTQDLHRHKITDKNLFRLAYIPPMEVGQKKLLIRFYEF